MAARYSRAPTPLRRAHRLINGVLLGGPFFDETSHKEAGVLLHLPPAILATLSPIPVSNTVPTFDTVKECRFEAGSVVGFDRCSRDETAALRQLQQAWTRFAGTDKKTCV